jgi:hypothetical protein
VFSYSKQKKALFENINVIYKPFEVDNNQYLSGYKEALSEVKKQLE